MFFQLSFVTNEQPYPVAASVSHMIQLSNFQLPLIFDLLRFYWLDMVSLFSRIANPVHV